MVHTDFVHLRVHTPFSLSEGALRIPDLVKLCTAEAMPAVAMTDRGNLFGAMEFSAACAGAGVQPIIGCLLAVGDPPEPGARREEPASIVLLAQSEAGYGHLVKLVSASFLESAPGEAPQIPWSRLEAMNGGLIAFTGGAGGPVDRLLAAQQDDAAALALGRLEAIFRDRLYVELMRHGGAVPPTEAALIELAYRRGLPLVATNDVHFADASMYEAHDALLCIAEGVTIGRTDRRRLTPDHRFKSAAEMRELFADVPEAIDNTLVIARRCAVQAPKRAPILPTFPDAGEGGEAAELRRQALAGLDTRLASHVFTAGMDDDARTAAAAPYHARLDYELRVIESMKYPGYFLIVADFIQWAKRQGIPVGPGRGSGAGSVVAWCLTITDLDPLRHGLLFERFLNPERVSMPDFDIDFCQERRDEVIRYVAARYGTDRVAQIITFGTLQARAALRDVGRVLEMAYGHVDRLCKLVPYNPAHPVTLAQAIEREPQLKEARDGDPQVRRLLDMALRLEGLHRHASTHAAGIVIGDRPLDELVPLYRDPRSSMPVTQFHMKDVEKAGLVKFDFLGLKTLSVLRRAVGLLADQGITLDLDALPLDDKPTYEVLSRGDTAGIFQLEGAGVRDVVRRLRPDTFSDIVALVALYRPGPMDNIPRFIACKHGEEQPDYMLPQLEPVLRETYGVIVYQEQVMEIAQVLAGYNLGSADLLRRAMGKKIKSEMEAQRDTFIQGAMTRGVSKPQATQVFELVARFADYGFNKSHAAAYALVAYQTAYLKAHHPVAFLAASMSFELASTDRLNVFRDEALHLGVRLLPPDINRSHANFSVEGGAVRYGLAAIKGVGLQAMETLVEERTNHGPFADLAEFADRSDGKVINRRQLEGLIRAGAFDGLNANRAQTLAAADALIARAGAAARGRGSGQVGLFEGAEAPRPPLPMPALADWTPVERLRHEHEAVGFYLSAHPLTAYAPALRKLAVRTASELEDMMAGTDEAEVRLAGVPIARRERTGSQGRRFAFVQMSDTSGTFEVVVFNDLLASAREMLDAALPLLVAVEARREGESVRLAARSFQPLDQAVAAATSGLRVILEDPRGIAALQSALRSVGKGPGTIRVVVPGFAGENVEIALQGGFALTPALWAQLDGAAGVVSYETQ